MKTTAVKVSHQFPAAWSFTNDIPVLMQILLYNLHMYNK